MLRPWFSGALLSDRSSRFEPAYYSSLLADGLQALPLNCLGTKNSRHVAGSIAGWTRLPQSEEQAAPRPRWSDGATSCGLWRKSITGCAAIGFHLGTSGRLALSNWPLKGLV